LLLDVSFIKNISFEPQKFKLSGAMDSPLVWQGDNIVFTGPVFIDGVIKQTEKRFIFVQGKFKTKIAVQCSRCLQQIETDLVGSFEGEFIPLGIAAQEEMEEDFPGQFYSGDILDLAGLIHEGITFALPMQFLCFDGCLGLCPHCGTNLNEGQCHCRKEQIDPRLEVLRKLLK